MRRLLRNLTKFASRFRVTLTLLGVICATFGVQLMLGARDPAMGARMGSLMANRVSEHGEVFRLVTYMFLHVNIVHLLFNMVALVQLGALVEALYGGRRMFLFFVLSGIFGGATSALFEGPTSLQMMGASGSIMGLAGIIMGLCIYGAEPYRSRLASSLGRSLIFGISLTFSAGIFLSVYVGPLVGNWAHLGGMMLGMAIAGVYNRPSPVPTSSDVAMSYGSFGVVLGAVCLTLAVGQRGAEDLDIRAVEVVETRLSLYSDGLPRALALSALMDTYEQAGVEDGDERFRKAAYRSGPQALSIAIGMAYAEEGREMELATLSRAWIHQDPTNAEARNSAAWMLVTGEDPAQRDPFEAMELVNAALSMLDADPDAALGIPPAFDPLYSLSRLLSGGPPSPEARKAGYLDTRAEALRQLGFLDLALEDQRQAVQIGEEVDSDQLDEMKARLDVLEEVAG
ncbi:MAG: rhomboid family intramembrane serine protease [Rhodobacterales bacterium]|nr:rhomboid family intramembrane serine protease [Rhodobacterales bacterium]